MGCIGLLFLVPDKVPAQASFTTVIIILKSSVTEDQIAPVRGRVESLGMKAHLSRGSHRTIVGVIGDESQFDAAKFQVLPGVADVIRVLPAYKLASNEAHPEPSVVDVAGVKVGGGNLAMIAGPCAIEGAQRLDIIAESVRASGANILRGGAYKPRTSPYAYQGMGEEGLKILRDVGQKHGMPVVTEVMDPRSVEVVERYTDMIQIGARNMQKFVLLTEVGRTKKPVLLKRGMSATVVDLLMSAEYILSQGNPNVVLCERGVKGFDTQTRNLFDLAAVPACKALSHLPIVVVSTSRSEDEIRHCYTEGANAFASKPASHAGFMRLIRSLRDHWLSLVVLPNPVRPAASDKAKLSRVGDGAAGRIKQWRLAAAGEEGQAPQAVSFEDLPVPPSTPARREELRKSFYACRDILSLDLPLQSGSQMTHAEAIASDPVDFDGGLIQAEQRQAIGNAFEGLTARETQVLRLRFGLEDGQERNLAEVGRALGISRERVRQIEVASLQKLRQRLSLQQVQ